MCIFPAYDDVQRIRYIASLLTFHFLHTLQAVVRGYSSAGFPTSIYHSALATVLAVDPRYVVIVAVADQRATRSHTDPGDVDSRRAGAQAVLIDSVVASLTVAAAEQLATTARSVAQALTTELRRLGLVDADIASITAAVQYPSSSSTPPPTAAAMLFGGLGVLGLGLVVGFGGLLFIFAATCLCCRCSSRRYLKVNPTEPTPTQPNDTAASELDNIQESEVGQVAVQEAESVEETGADWYSEEGDSQDRLRLNSSLYQSPEPLPENYPGARVLPPVRPPGGWVTAPLAEVQQRLPA